MHDLTVVGRKCNRRCPSNIAIAMNRLVPFVHRAIIRSSILYDNR